MITQKTLENGLTILTKDMPSTQAVTVLILANTGSRNESRDIRGLAHFQEHMFFKGGKKYTNAKEVAATVDNVGGAFNAFTGKEYVGYYVKVEQSHTHLALNLLSDMLLHAQFNQEEIDKERGVILEEYAMYQDTPMYQVGWEYENLLFGDTQLGWDQLGLPEIIKSVQRDDFLKFKEKWYQPGNLAICIAGAVNGNTIQNDIEKYFKFKENKETPKRIGFEKESNPRRLFVKNKKTEQTHLVLGTYGTTYKDPLAKTSLLLGVIIGGNMSSRLWQKIREDRGYAYYIKTSSEHFTDTGSFYTRCGVNTGTVKESIKIIIEEYQKAAKDGVTEQELKNAKEYAKGQMTLYHEDSEHAANSIGRRFFFEGELLELEERKKEIDDITLDQVNEIAKKIFSQKLFLSVIGPHEQEDFTYLI